MQLSALKLFFCFFCLAVAGKSQTNNIDRLYQLALKKDQADSVRAAILDHIGSIVYHDTTGLAAQYLDGKSNPTDIHEAVLLSDIYGHIGYMWMDDKQKCGQQLFWTLKAKKLLSGQNLPERQAYLSKQLGRLYFLNGMLNESVDEYLIAEKQYKSLRNKKELLEVYESIASIYDLFGHRSESDKYWKRIRAAKSSDENCDEKTSYLEHKAWQYFDDNKYKLAIKYQLKLIQLNNKCAPESRRGSMTQLARIYITAGMYQKALRTLDTLAMLDRKEESDIHPGTWYYYGYLYQSQKHYTQAIKAYTSCVELAEVKGIINNWSYYYAYQHLREIYETGGDVEKAAGYAVKFNRAKEAEKRERNVRELRELCTQLEYHEKNNSPANDIEYVRYEIQRIEKELAEGK